MAKSGPHTALERFTGEYIRLQNKIKFNVVVTVLEINFFEKIIFCLENYALFVSYASADRDIKGHCRAYGRWMASVFALH